MSPRKNSKKLRKGTKENIIQVIDALSIITGRKSKPKEDAGGAMSFSLKETDTLVAALSLQLLEIDDKWVTTGAKKSVDTIRGKRRWIIGSLYATAIASSLIVMVGGVIANIFIEHWSKWLILGGAALLLILGAMTIPNLIINPTIENFDNQIPEKYQKECESINLFIKGLLTYIK